ncbi:hypothetical protein BC332_01516 [Capsicum chinense]|nr:hypothetical protein BC332_01516 [Capsicum chinense]
MGRKKVKLAFIENINERKSSYKKRQKGFIKKAHELKTLCNVEMAAIICSPYHIEPKVIPNMVTQKKFTEERKVKIEEQLRKIRKESRVKDLTNKMYEMLNGKDTQVCMSLNNLNDLDYVLNENIKKVSEMIKGQGGGESSTSNYQQPTIGPMVPSGSIFEGPRDPLLYPTGTPVLVVPLVDPLIIPSGDNFERPRAPLLDSDVASMEMIPSEASSMVPLDYTSQVSQPQINPSMSLPLMDASVPMNNNENYSVGFPTSPPLSEMLDWNDDIIKPARRTETRGNFYVSPEDNMDRVRLAHGAQTWSRVATSNCCQGVPLVPTNLSPGGDTPAQSPQGDISNEEFCRSIQLLTQIVVSLSHYSNGARLVPPYPPCQFYGQLHHEFCHEGKNQCFTYAPAPKDATSGSDTGLNCLHAPTTRQELEVSLDIVHVTLRLIKESIGVCGVGMMIPKSALTWTFVLAMVGGMSQPDILGFFRGYIWRNSGLGPYHIEPKVIPNMVTQKKFTEERKVKIEEQLRKIRKENRVKDLTNKMYEMLNGKDTQVCMSLNNLNDLDYVLNENIKKVSEMIKGQGGGESSTLNYQQPTIGPMVPSGSIFEGPRDPLLYPTGTPVLVVPLVDPLIIPSGDNFERPRAPLLESDVASMEMIHSEASSMVPLAYTSQVSQPQINPSMSLPLMDASVPMNNNENYSVGFPTSPPLSEMLDWNDDIVTLLEDPYFNNISFQDPRNGNNNF